MARFFPLLHHPANEFARMARGSCQAAWACEQSCTIHIGLKELRRILRLALFYRTRVQNRLGTTDAFWKMRTHFLQGNEVSETGNSDSVTLGLLLASLESRFYQRIKSLI
jgi:hypothetical protein